MDGHLDLDDERAAQRRAEPYLGFSAHLLHRSLDGRGGTRPNRSRGACRAGTSEAVEQHRPLAQLASGLRVIPNEIRRQWLFSLFTGSAGLSPREGSSCRRVSKSHMG
jgi:hypothetical protein